jgi:hypothetical protein
MKDEDVETFGVLGQMATFALLSPEHTGLNLAIDATFLSEAFLAAIRTR